MVFLKFRYIGLKINLITYFTFDIVVILALFVNIGEKRPCSFIVEMSGLCQVKEWKNQWSGLIFTFMINDEIRDKESVLNFE